MQLQKAIQIYLKWKKSHTTVAYDRYKVRLDDFYNFLKQFNKLQLSTLTGDDVVDFHEAMETAGYSRATIAYSARILRNFFWFWHGRGETNFNPKEIIPIRFINADKDIIDEDDFEILPESKRSFYLFTRTSREKEEWFNRFMVGAKFMQDWNHQNPPKERTIRPDPNYETFKVKEQKFKMFMENYFQVRKLGFFGFNEV